MTRRRWTGLGAALLATTAAGAPPAAAQGGPGVAPDLAGIFTGRRCVNGEGQVCPELSRDGAEAMLTARARAFTEAFDELAAPKYDCAPATLPGLFGDPYAFELTQLADRVTPAYEKDDVVRTIWLEGHGHREPDVGAFFTHGHSTGRYEGDRLVVETTRFTFDPAGIAGDFLSAPSSTQKRMVERYWRAGDHLRMELIRFGDALVVTGHPARAAGAHAVDVFGGEASITRPDGTPVPQGVCAAERAAQSFFAMAQEPPQRRFAREDARRVTNTGRAMMGPARRHP